MSLVFYNTCPEKPQFWINLVTKFLNYLIRAQHYWKGKIFLLSIDTGKTITQASIFVSQPIFDLSSSMSLDNPSKPPYFLHL